jgi:hypothetical protein
MIEEPTPLNEVELINNELRVLLGDKGLDHYDLLRNRERRPPPFMRWDALYSASTSKVLVGYQLVAFVMPFLAKILLVAEIDLPISLFLYYLAGILFLLSGLIVRASCPFYCRSNYSYANFVSEGRDSLSIRILVRDAYEAHAQKDRIKANHFIKCVLFGPGYSSTDEKVKGILIRAYKNSVALSQGQLTAVMELSTLNEEKLQRLFWELRYHASSIHPRQRLAGFWLLAAGFVCADFILVMNGLEVLDSLS